MPKRNASEKREDERRDVGELKLHILGLTGSDDCLSDGKRKSLTICQCSTLPALLSVGENVRFRDRLLDFYVD